MKRRVMPRAMVDMATGDFDSCHIKHGEEGDGEQDSNEVHGGRAALRG